MLPNCPDNKALPVVRPDLGLSYVATGMSTFVGPDLDVIYDNAAPQAIVVSAAGAMGKSTLARQVAHLKGAPYWDLALGKPVAGHSMTGLLSDGFGVKNYALVHEHLEAGKLFLLIDALDEGRVRAETSAAFDAFLENVAQVASSSKQIAVVLLSRVDAAERSYVTLLENGISCQFMQLRPFNSAQARTYVDKLFVSLGKVAAQAKEKRSEEFARARDAVLSWIESQVLAQGQDDKVARDFVGYAPVLDSIARLLDDESHNFHAIASQYESAQGGRMTPSAVLERIITDILERECAKKLIPAIRKPLEHAAAETGFPNDNWQRLYRADEQTARVIGIFLRTEPALEDLLPQMAARFRQEYEERIDSFVREHPFLNLQAPTRISSVVFEAYLLAKALVTNVGGTRAAAVAYCQANPHRLTRLFAEFFAAQTRVEQAPGAEIAIDHIPLVFNALKAYEPRKERANEQEHVNGPTVRLDVDVSNDENQNRLTVTFRLDEAEGEDPDLGRVFSYECLVPKGAALRLPGDLKNVFIGASCDVELGNPSAAELRLGPDVQVFVEDGELRFFAPTVVVEAASSTSEGDSQAQGEGDAADSDVDVTLEADTADAALVRKIVCYGRLRVSWPTAKAFPWTEYSGTRSAAPRSPQAALVFKRFRRIAMTFRSHKKGQMARAQKKIHGTRVLKGKVGETLLSKLKADGVIVSRDYLYVWHGPAADEVLGIAWHSLRVGGESPKLSKYIDDFVAANPKLFQ